MQKGVTVRTALRCCFRLRESETDGRLFGGFFQASTTTLRDEFIAQAKMPELVVRFLVEMDKKLDVLLMHAQQEHVEEQFSSWGRVVSLHPKQCLIECKEPLAAGDYLEVVAFLQDFPFQALSLLGQVRGVAVGEPSSPPASVYLLDLGGMLEVDQDNLIRFIFQEERRQIRQQKNQ